MKHNEEIVPRIPDAELSWKEIGQTVVASGVRRLLRTSRSEDQATSLLNRNRTMGIGHGGSRVLRRAHRIFNGADTAETEACGFIARQGGRIVYAHPQGFGESVATGHIVFQWSIDRDRNGVLPLIDPANLVACPYRQGIVR